MKLSQEVAGLHVYLRPHLHRAKIKTEAKAKMIKEKVTNIKDKIRFGFHFHLEWMDLNISFSAVCLTSWHWYMSLHINESNVYCHRWLSDRWFWEMTIKVNEVPGKKVKIRAALVCFTFMYLKRNFKELERKQFSLWTSRYSLLAIVFSLFCIGFI